MRVIISTQRSFRLSILQRPKRKRFEVLFACSNTDKFPYRSRSLAQYNDSVLVKLTNYLRSRGHELRLCSRHILFCSTNNSLQPHRPTYSDSGDKNRNDCKRSHRQDKTIFSAHRLALEWHGHTFYKESQEPEMVWISSIWILRCEMTSVLVITCSARSERRLFVQSFKSWKSTEPTKSMRIIPILNWSSDDISG